MFSERKLTRYSRLLAKFKIARGVFLRPLVNLKKSFSQPVTQAHNTGLAFGGVSAMPAFSVIDLESLIDFEGLDGKEVMC